MRNGITFVFAALAGVMLAAQSQPAQQTSSGTSPRANQQVTITGCVAAGPNNTFTLTAAPSSSGTNQEPATGTTAKTPVGSKVAKTITYTLTGGDQNQLKAQVGKTVQVTGTEAAPQVSTKGTDQSTHTATAQGTSGATPTVKTTTQTQIVVRQLNVTSVKPVAGSCDLVK